MYPEDSEVKFKISHFPDGQQDITLLAYDYPHIQIKSRFNSFKDLELIICATKALRRVGCKNISLYIPYLLGARSDRQFIEGGTSYLVDVIAPIINSLNFESVTVVDVHSDVAAACINNLRAINNFDLVGESLALINSNNFLLVSPDSGALKKVYKIAQSIDYKREIVTCSKSRDTDGNLSKTVVPWIQNSEKLDRIIIDDICDGGATFINIAKEIRIQGVTGKIYLIVTHGIFSKGFKELSQCFNGIYTTDSIRFDFDWEQKERDKTEICKIIKV